MSREDNIQQFIIKMNKDFYCWCWDDSEEECLATNRADPCNGDLNNRPGWCPLIPVKHTAIAPGNKKVWVEE